MAKKIDWFDDKLQRKILEYLAQNYPFSYHFTNIMNHVSYAFENREKLHKNIHYLSGLGLTSHLQYHNYNDCYDYSLNITPIGISNVEFPAETLYQQVVKDTKIHIV